MRMLTVLSLCLVFQGCSGKDYEGSTRLPLTGEVKYNGELVDGGGIAFLPQDATTQRPASGIITNGQYSIPEPQGVNEGTYRVEIRWGRPTGKQILDSGDTGEMIDETKQVIPAKYNTNSELTITVAPDKTKFDFDLKD